MKVFYDKDKSIELMQRIEDEFGERARKTARGEEMHVSDLTGCLLKPYCRLLGLERKMTKTIVGVMVFGIVAENMLGWTYPSEELQYQSNLWVLEKSENIFGHIDIYEDMKYPIEIKSSRKNVFKSNELPKYWVEQLMAYMSIQGSWKGWIIMFNVFSTQIMAFQVQMTAEDRLDWLIELNRRALAVRNAFKEKDCRLLDINPHEYEWCLYKDGCPRKEFCGDKWKELQSQKRKNKKEKYPK